jgi:carbonic anhydrase
MRATTACLKGLGVESDFTAMAAAKPKRTSVLACASAALLLASCTDREPDANAHGDDPVVHWGYESDNGPENWGSMDAAWRLCSSGREQSPVDITSAREIELPAVDINTPSEQEVAVLNQAGVIRELDNGHTIQINSNNGERMTVGDKTYALIQFHFHAPSEHTVDGEHFPMEMHFVHQANDGGLAVVGVLLREGATNPGIAPLWAQLPEGPGTETMVRIPAGFAEHIFPNVGTGFYHYDGSLTTPPCSEGVKWYVRKTPTQLSKDQIAAFTAAYDHNNRPVQALNERTLYLDENPTVTIDFGSTGSN